MVLVLEQDSSGSRLFRWLLVGDIFLGPYSLGTRDVDGFVVGETVAGIRYV